MFVKVNALRHRGAKLAAPESERRYPQLQRKTPSAMAGFSLFHITSDKNKEAPGD
jgi:hypothetical protein